MNKRLQLSARFHVPEFQHAIITGGGKHPAVGTERHGLYRTAEATQRLKFFPRDDVPNSGRVISTRRGQKLLVRAENATIDHVGVAGENASHFSRCHIQKADLAIASGGNQCFAVVTKR